MDSCAPQSGLRCTIARTGRAIHALIKVIQKSPCRRMPLERGQLQQAFGPRHILRRAPPFQQH